MKAISGQSPAVIVFAFSVILYAFCFSAEAQQAKKVPRIGFVSGTAFQTPGPDFEAFRQGLRDLGYFEGKNILVEYRYLATERTQDIVTELLQLKVDIFVLRSHPSIRADAQAVTNPPSHAR